MAEPSQVKPAPVETASSSSGGPPQPSPVPLPRSIKNGLQLRHANREAPFRYFSYTVAKPHPTTPPTPVDWHLLSPVHVESEHIRIHELKEGDNLKSSIESYKAAHAKAVIIINDSDSKVLNEEHRKSVDGFDGYLIAVLSTKDGHALFDVLGEEEIYAKLEVSSIDAANMGGALDEDTAVLEMDPTIRSLKHEQQSRGVLDKLFRTNRNVFDVKNEVKKLIFDGDTMKRITNDAGLFTLVMSTFSQYERTSKPEPNQIFSLIKNSFVPYFELAFATEFPFYLILAYRFKKYRHLYECEELGPFIFRCIETFEGLSLTKIAETLNAFYNQKDFDIMYGSEEANMSVFVLLANACRELMNTSVQIKRSKPSNKVIYTKMLWITIFLKCLTEKGTANRTDANIWQNLTKQTVAQSVTLNNDIIEEFKMGVAFADMLHLPHEFSFTSHHMTHFLVSDHFVRPLILVRDFYQALESNIKNDRELLVHILINLRSHYTNTLTSNDMKKKCSASQEGTLLGVIEEGISFLDGMKEMWCKRGWNKGEQAADFRIEIEKWLKLFLSIVKLTDPNATSLLKKLLANTRNSVITDQLHRKAITDQLLEDAKKNFPYLTVQQFFALYKSFRIWPINFLHDFLEQYKIPSGVKINDATWSEFFNVVLDRLRSEEPQKYLLSFICKIAEKYREDERAKEFIPDLLQMEVPRLFVTPPTEGEELEESSVGQSFKEFLLTFIQRNNLRLVLMKQIQTLISSITDKKEEINFQWIVLNVLQSVVVPELKSLEGTDSEQLRNILPISVNILVQNTNWFGSLSPRQKFCWGVVATACSKITLTANNFDWVQNQTVVNQLGIIYNSYCNARKLYGDGCLLSDHTPEEIASCKLEDVTKYFQFVRRVQEVLQFWYSKFTSSKINFDELMSYASNSVALNSLGRAVCAQSFVMEMDSITQIKETYLYNFEQLHVYLLRYVPGHPEVKYCTLPALFSKYGVAFPPQVQDVIVKHVAFPGEGRIPKQDRLHNIIPLPSSGRTFEPGQDLTLQLSQAISLSQLQSLNEELASFLEPFLECLDMLVFFHLHQSEMFEKHLLKSLENLVETAPSPSVKPHQNIGGFSIQPILVSMARREKRDKNYEGIPPKILRRALEQVKSLLIKIVRGTATYSDIIAEGAIKLESINTDKEFSVLTSFSETMEMGHGHYEGLLGVRSMLELFQFTQHIQTIDAVFEQYGLDNCRNDPTLKQLLLIMEELRPEGSRARLTPLEAMEKMKFIKESLCLQNTSNYQCLNLFPAVANSAAFYQFIRDKQFIGTRGHAIFREQYQLITAQLQHEEYDENVLNHLRVAFEFLSPFMEQNISFKDLMRRVSKLDTTYGLKQLETVNENITLVRLWFSRAEGDTIENVANELDNILLTGIYQFILSEHQDSRVFLIYKTQQKIRQPSRKTANQFEDSSEKNETDGVEGKLGADFSTLPTVYPSPQPQTFTGHPLSREETSPFSNTTMGGVDQRWTSEQISDFVRKLGFLDSEKEGGYKIKEFLHLNSTANKLMDLYIKLHELGHPDHQGNRGLPPLMCNISSEQADVMVSSLEGTLQDWTHKVVALRQRYTWLLFFSVPKLLRLYDLFLFNEHIELDAIIRSISFLVENDSSVRRKMKPVIQKSLRAVQENIEEQSPMHLLGHFLELVCSSPDIQPFLLKTRSSRRGSVSLPKPSMTIASPSSSNTSLGSYQLHYAPGYTHSQLLCLITELYEGVPEPFEVFRCSPETSLEELNLFTERMRHHPLVYLILQVNKLPFKLQELLMDLPKRPFVNGGSGQAIVHFIETAPSVLREVPWITCREYKEDGLRLSFDAAARICKRKIIRQSDFTCIQLVIGRAGDGKTHYIRKQMCLCPDKLTIAVNEAFTPLSAINKLHQLQVNTVGCAIFFNFTMLPYESDGQDETEKRHLETLRQTISWFFFDLLILGYVEDPSTGASFRMPGGLEWAIYIEVPSLGQGASPEESLHLFCQAIPALGLLGSPHVVHHATPYAVDDDVQLVCKYLRAFKAYSNGQIGINKLYREAPPNYTSGSSLNQTNIVKFSLEIDLPPEECHALLTEYMPDHIQMTKITQKLFIKYMKRRCAFLDNFPAFNFNTGVGEPLNDGSNKKTDTRQLGSTLMTTMLEEVNNFCHPSDKQDWSVKPHQQLIYDFRDGGGSFGLLSLNMEHLPEENRKRFRNIGFELHPPMKLQERGILDQYLARALGLPSEEGNRLSAIDEAHYVLTLDYTIKMLNIHERYECGIPVIIKGETGVGKTALVDMLSRLWSNAFLYQWNKERGIIFDNIRELLGAKAEDSLDTYQLCIETMEALAVGREVPLENLVVLCELSDPTSASGQFYSRVRDLLLNMANNPASALLVLPVDKEKREKKERGGVSEGEGYSLDEHFKMLRENNTSYATAVLLQQVLKAKVRSTFHKLNVHAALTPDDVKEFFDPVFGQAQLLYTVYQRGDESRKAKIRLPFVTVFLDEVNTSSCLGLFKEILVDRTLDGQAIPPNVFIVAACNPHRGNSMSTHAAETWVRSSYYVRPLHPTLEFLIWDYGSLNEHQERDYITAKLKMLHNELPNIEVVTLTGLIVESQSLMRRYASRQLRKQGMKPDEVEVSSHSCVSQRDIQRVFTFYQWLMSVYQRLKQHGERNDYNRRAVMVALGLVYYMRLNSEFRLDYQSILDKKYRLPNEVNFTRAFQDELDWFCDASRIELPPGIAKTQALKENLFATIVCTVTHTPLIIVGAPGSSKTLSFNLTIANLKGLESKMPLFRDTSIFKSLDPHFYQCSRRTTSNEIQTVFSRAINRQRSHSKFSLPIYCVVFMDEAGLPEESHESLKVLHYHLDKQEVSFVAITNHVLDAAKTNRAVSLFRPEVSKDDLTTLAKGCLCENPLTPPPELRRDLDIIVQFCPAYISLMENENMKKFFGLRDFIHFINYLRRRREEMLTPQLVMEGLERNFNGIHWVSDGEKESFQWLCQLFLGNMQSTTDDKPITLEAVKQRSILEVLHNSLLDRPERGGGENEVRYKLIIDPSEDSSLVQLLMTFGVLDRKKTHVYVCSDFPGDGQLQKINTIAAIRHSAIEGHTVVMSQTDDIHESFYDLFNQRFRCIDDPEHGPRYYANIAIGAHLKPCRVHKDFQCVVVVRQSEVKDTPAPFLNRFEKYCISHQTLLATAMGHLPPCVRLVLKAAKTKLEEFIRTVDGNASLYGLKHETLDSLLLSLLPPYGHTYQDTPPDDPVGQDVRIYLLQELLRSLRHSAGFAVPVTTLGELEMDANYLFPLLCIDPSFDEAYQNLTMESSYRAVSEALKVLHTAADPQEEDVAQIDMSPEACLAVGLLQQWLIRHMTKQLMRLMTSEAVTVHRKQIPASYIDNYLSHQQHFSLKKLIDFQLRALQSCKSNTNLCASKLLAFTRSSPLVHQLPSLYNSSAERKKEKERREEDDRCIKELIYSDPHKVTLCKLTSLQSQGKVQEALKSFIHSQTKEILVLVANMQESKSETINHLRVMIEEVEAQATPTSCKLFVVLLHFPPAMFFDACYPSLFLRGWSHYYLDSIGRRSDSHPGTLDIEEWFQRCCFPEKDFPEDTLMISCQYLLKDIIPVLASQVIYGTRSQGPFTCHMKASERKNKLKELLDNKGIGLQLLKLFRSCWRPPVMVEHLEKAAIFTRSRESSLNITDAVQAIFQSHFTDFMIVMISRINDNRNIDILFAGTCPEAVNELFLSLLGSFNVPKLDQLRTLASSLSVPKPQDYQPSFPFFDLVFKEMDKLVEDSKIIIGQQENILEEAGSDGDSTPPPTSSFQSDPEGVMKGVADHIIQQMQHELTEDSTSRSSHALYIALSFFKRHPDVLWSRYFTDFIHNCLHLETGASSLSHRIVCAFFSELQELPPLQRIVYLHIYVEYNKLSLGNIASLLRPLERIWQVAEGSPNMFTPSSQSPAKDFITAIEETKYPFGDPLRLSQFVVSALFSALIGSVYPLPDKESPDKDEHFKYEVLLEWYNTYLQVMTMPALIVHLYSTPLPPEEQAKFNISHSTFLLIHSYPKPTKEILVNSTHVFMSMLSKYFNTALKLKSQDIIPGLTECATILGEVIKTSAHTSLIKNVELSRRILEGLLSHFFSQHRSTYNSADREWFLKLANTQQEWRASDQLLSEVVISSSYSGDLVSAMETSLQRSRYHLNIGVDLPYGCVSIFMFKIYLSHILGNFETLEDPSSFSNDTGPLQMYLPEARRHIGVILATDLNGEEPSCYIPVFYQDCKAIKKQTENHLMQQPLCHLYFLTVLEHLMAEPRDINSLVRLVETISQLHRPQSLDPGEKILLHIEKQAVIQCLLKQIAIQFNCDANKPVISKDLGPIIKELNEILSDESMGGGIGGGHHLTLGMHLLKHLRSARKFTELLTTRYESCQEIRCMQGFHQQLKTKTESKPYLFPFMQVDDGSVLSKLYHQIKAAMLSVDQNRGSQAAVDQLIKIADECYRPPKRVSKAVMESGAPPIDKKQAFKMMTWLVAYYEFFVNKNTSNALSLAIGKQLKDYIKDDNFTRLVQCFLYPRWLIQKPESPIPLREDAPVIEVLPNGRVQNVQHGGEQVDPLYELLMPPKLSPKRDQSEIDLCHCLANLIAVIIGCQPQSTHLWYNLFSPNELKDTYMPGFMYKSKISPEGLLYDCGVELTADGQYGRPDYIKHATRGTYSLHSLYFLLWSNFGALCMSLLTQKDGQSKIHGSIISDWQAIRHYCVSQLRTTWEHLRNNLGLSDEERSFLVTRCLMNMYQINSDPNNTLHGRLRTSEELDKYESLWHTRVFLPAWLELREKFTQYSMLWQNQLFIDMRHLEVVYPQFPSEKDFINVLHGEDMRPEVHTLKQFVLEKERLQVGGQLLPDLIALYQWIHTHLSHLVTVERAYNKLTIGRVITLASRRGNPTLLDLYMRVKDKYNQYVELVGGAIGQGACAAVRRGNRIYTIADDLPFLHFLTDSEDEEDGNDWLFAVISDIVGSQNLLIQSLYANTDNELTRLLPCDSTYIYATEANEHSCIVGHQLNYRGMSEFLQIVRSRLEQNNASTPIPGTFIRTTPKLMSITGESTVPTPQLTFNLSQLQEDTVSRFLSGKPIIRDVNSLRTLFKFRHDKTTVVRRTISDPMGGAYSLTSIEEILHPLLRLPLPDGLEKRIEYEFHSASYHTLTEIVVGLKTALGHLAKIVPLEGSVSQEVKETSLRSFMLNEFDDHLNEQTHNVLVEIGIRNLSDSQLAFLEGLKLSCLYSSLSLFLRWVKEGLYDFSGLPLALKVHLSVEDSQVLTQIPSLFQGSSSQLLSELKGLNEVLLHVEGYLVKEVNKNARRSLIEVLKDLGLLENEIILQLIPDTVLVHHYVQLRLHMRRLIATAEQHIAVESSLHNDNNTVWAEYVDDLWKSYLTHLRDEGFLYIDQALLMDHDYGFYGEDWETIETTSELDRDLNKDETFAIYDQDSYEPISMDVDIDPLLLNNNAQGSLTTMTSGFTMMGSTMVTPLPPAANETLREGLADPKIREEMLRMISQKKDIEQHAKDWTPDMISDFLIKIKLDKYAQKFLEEEIKGTQLLTADREMFTDLGVASAIHSTRIAVLFRRELQGKDTPTYDMSQLISNSPKLSQFTKKLASLNIDVDMLLYAQQNDYLVDLLKECNITKSLDKNRFDTALKELTPPSSPTARGLTSSYVAFSTPV